MFPAALRGCAATEPDGRDALKTKTTSRRQGAKDGTSLAQQLYGALKREIVTCQLKPGLSFTENWLCRKYSASRTTVRDACLRLSKEELLHWVPKKGYSVSEMSIQDLNELFQLRAILETAAAEMACTSKDPVRLERAYQLARVTYEAGDLHTFPVFLEANHEYHSLIAEMSGNRRLSQQLGQVLVQFSRFSYLTMAADSYGPDVVDEHKRIFEAIKNGDAGAARRYTLSHMQHSKERAVRYFLG
jgi:GntR family transcriptional regulator, rspAB operon transcriptional repressor